MPFRSRSQDILPHRAGTDIDLRYVLIPPVAVVSWCGSGLRTMMEKGRIRFRGGYSLIHNPTLDDKFAANAGRDEIARRVRHWQKNGVSLLILAPATRWMGSEALSAWHRVCREEGMTVILLAHSSLARKDFLYYRRVNQDVRAALWKGHVLLLYSVDVLPAVRAYLPTLLIHPVEIQPDRAVEAADLSASPEELDGVRTVVREYARSIHPYLPSIGRQQNVGRKSRYSLRFKLLSIITAVVVLSSLTTIFLATDLFKRLSSVLIQDYNLSVSRMIGQSLDTELENVIAWSRLVSAGQEKSALLFERNPSVVGLATVRYGAKGGDASIDTVHLNPALEKDYGLELSWLKALASMNAIDASASNPGTKPANPPGALNPAGVAGRELLQVNPDLPTYRSVRVGDRPMLLAVSLRQDDEHVLLLFLSPEKLFAGFRGSRASSVFRLLLVDGTGHLISSDDTSHQEGMVVEDLPIVQAMLRSPVDNGSQIFSYGGTEYLGSFQILKGSGFGVISIVPSSRAFEAVYRVQRENLLILVLILTLAFVFVYLFSRTLSLPIVNLLHATHQIEQGNYSVSIEPRTRDEIGDLTRAFVSMAGGLRERQIIKEEFGKFVDPGIAERAIQGSLRLGGEKKVCTVLFVDLRNFTGFSESREPEEVVDFLNRYFTEMVDCITITDGVVDKFIGDAIMAHWGALVPQKDEARRAVNSALFMRAALQELNRTLQSEGLPGMHFGVGINTGSVIVGQVGSQKRLEFTAIGDAVNLASRIEYLNKQFATDILISESTRRLLGDQYRLVPMEAVHIRGKSEMQQTYAVLGRMDDPEAPQTLDDLRLLLHTHPIGGAE